LSKNFKGTLGEGMEKKDGCDVPTCKTFKTRKPLIVEVATNRPCDSKMALAFDGRLVVEQLITVYDTDASRRGVHAGDFEWFGKGLHVTGRISGVTNEGTHRSPAFDPCQKCGDRDVMEGRLCGQVVESKDPALKDCQVLAAYRIKIIPPTKG